MSIMDSIKKIKLPSSKNIINIPSTIKTESKKIDINTIDVLYFSGDYKYCILTTGFKTRNISIPIVNIKIPENLSVLVKDDCISYNKSTNRELIIVNEKSPYAIKINSIKFDSSYINIIDENNQNTQIEMNQKLLSTLGSVKLIDDINEKSNDGMIIIFILGLLVGSVLMSLILAYIYS